MSRILIYTQQPVLGGSLRMLLNLARHLASRHEVTVALPPVPYAAHRHDLLRHYRDLTIIDPQTAMAAAASFDVLVGHFPFEIDELARAYFPRKIAVSMEIISRHGPIIDEDTTGLFDRIVHLHPDQVAHLSASTREKLCAELPIINNVDFEPDFEATRYLASVGGLLKLDLAAALETVRRTRGIRGLRIHSVPTVRLRRAGLSPGKQLRAWRYRATGRLSIQRPELDVRRLYRSFDCLVHTPAESNGTSVVVSDALTSGRLVLLSPLESHRRAYAGLAGVHFADEVGADITDLLAGYDTRTGRRIRESYRSRYDRGEVLRQWESELLS